MNTRILYLYRDAANYKVYHECVIAGEITDEQVDAIIKCLEGGLWFKAGMVDLPDHRFDEQRYDESVDHPWFELSKYGFAKTEFGADVDMTVEELVDLFRKAAEKGWEEML